LLPHFLSIQPNIFHIWWTCEWVWFFGIFLLCCVTLLFLVLVTKCHPLSICNAQMLPILHYMSMRALDKWVTCTKMTQPIELPFGGQTYVGPKKPCIRMNTYEGCYILVYCNLPPDYCLHLSAMVVAHWLYLYSSLCGGWVHLLLRGVTIHTRGPSSG